VRPPLTRARLPAEADSTSRAASFYSVLETIKYDNINVVDCGHVSYFDKLVPLPDSEAPKE
jgi:hypothetical protein